ncbi:MAG: hypothetical protein JO104_03070, partial [Candidatus Eremiobacteraeota bacterium]|nr:hypothetical protein [Candidatus Eremiobacteraeota bacterium]
QYQTGVGGTLTIKFSNAPVTAAVALVPSGSSVDGTTVIVTASGYCTGSTTSTYDPTTHIMSGSYKSVYGCTGEAGTFTLKHRCIYKGTRASEDFRPETGIHNC